MFSYCRNELLVEPLAKQRRDHPCVSWYRKIASINMMKWTRLPIQYGFSFSVPLILQQSKTVILCLLFFVPHAGLTDRAVVVGDLSSCVASGTSFQNRPVSSALNICSGASSSLCNNSQNSFRNLTAASISALADSPWRFTWQTPWRFCHLHSQPSLPVKLQSSPYILFANQMAFSLIIGPLIGAAKDLCCWNHKNTDLSSSS